MLYKCINLEIPPNWCRRRHWVYVPRVFSLHKKKLHICKHVVMVQIEGFQKKGLLSNINVLAIISIIAWTLALPYLWVSPLGFFVGMFPYPSYLKLTELSPGARNVGKDVFQPKVWRNPFPQRGARGKIGCYVKWWRDWWVCQLLAGFWDEVYRYIFWVISNPFS